MKATILALLLTLGVHGQQTDYVKVHNVTDTVMVGDSITVKFTWNHNSSGNGMSRLQLWTSSYLQDCMYQYSSFLVADTNYYKVKIVPAMGFGDARIYSNSTVSPGYKKFYIKQNDVGVNEYNKASNVTDVRFYDIYGKEKPSQNEGLTIRITTYSNGYQKKDKIICTQ